MNTGFIILGNLNHKSHGFEAIWLAFWCSKKNGSFSASGGKFLGKSIKNKTFKIETFSTFWEVPCGIWGGQQGQLDLRTLHWMFMKNRWLLSIASNYQIVLVRDDRFGTDHPFFVGCNYLFIHRGGTVRCASKLIAALFVANAKSW